LKKSSAGLFSIKPSGHLAALLTALLYGTVKFIVEHKWHSAHGWKNAQSRNERYCPAIKEVGHEWYQLMGYIFLYMSVKFLHFDAISQGPKNSRIPGPKSLPFPLVMDMHASKTLCTGLYKS
jgi:hypothetical protein